jgi:hypothetical protein
MGWYASCGLSVCDHAFATAACAADSAAPPPPHPPPRIKWLIWQAEKTVRAAAVRLRGLGAHALAHRGKGLKLPTTKVLEAVCTVYYDDSSAKKDRAQVLAALTNHMRSNLGALPSRSGTADGSTGDADRKCGEGRSRKKAATPQQDRACEGEREAQQEEGEEESDEESEGDDIACELCHHTENGEQMLLCDRCDDGYHTFCVGLEDIPQDEW